MHLITSQFWTAALCTNKDPFIQLSCLGLNAIKGGLKNTLFSRGMDQITGYSSRHGTQVWEESCNAKQNLNASLNRTLVLNTFYRQAIIGSKRSFL